eukprot:SAG11_NODE_29291_length_312_cov_1.089202_1_plen_58_part_10
MLQPIVARYNKIYSTSISHGIPNGINVTVVHVGIYCVGRANTGSEHSGTSIYLYSYYT